MLSPTIPQRERNLTSVFVERSIINSSLESPKLGSLAPSPPSRYFDSFHSRLRCLGMLGKALTYPLLSLDSAAQSCYCTADLSAATSSIVLSNVSFYGRVPPRLAKAAWTSKVPAKKWILQSTARIEGTFIANEDKSMWEECRQALSAFNFSVEEKDKILGKAFGLVNSPYWGEEREKEVPKFETVNGIIEYLRSLSLSDDDLSKLLKKFPEVLGCSLEEELKTNVQILGKDWGIEGKSLRNLLLRNPRVLGYNVDCKGDCMAQCTRCWVRF